MEGFLFKPGDLVTIGTEAAGPQPPKYRILERLTQECVGGIQRHYRLRSFNYSTDGKFASSEFMLQDFEVAAYPSEEKLAKRVEAAQAKEDERYKRRYEKR